MRKVIRYLSVGIARSLSARLPCSVFNIGLFGDGGPQQWLKAT